MTISIGGRILVPIEKNKLIEAMRQYCLVLPSWALLDECVSNGSTHFPESEHGFYIAQAVKFLGRVHREDLGLDHMDIISSNILFSD